MTNVYLQKLPYIISYAIAVITISVIIAIIINHLYSDDILKICGD